MHIATQVNATFTYHQRETWQCSVVRKRQRLILPLPAPRQTYLQRDSWRVDCSRDLRWKLWPASLESAILWENAWDVNSRTQTAYIVLLVIFPTHHANHTKSQEGCADCMCGTDAQSGQITTTYQSCHDFIVFTSEISRHVSQYLPFGW